MSKKVVAIVGSYRKGGMVDSAVDAILNGAMERGANTSKIYLIDKDIEFCTNCRACTQTPGEERGKCPIDDDMNAVLAEIEAADSIVLGSPINFGNLTAIFRRFMERLIATAYWPWGKAAPSGRRKLMSKKAALVCSSAAPGIFIPLLTGAPWALKTTAKALGAEPVGSLWIGLAARRQSPTLSERQMLKAKAIGARLA